MRLIKKRTYGKLFHEEPRSKNSRIKRNYISRIKGETLKGGNEMFQRALEAIYLTMTACKMMIFYLQQNMVFHL
jgi:hypothetical protein